MMPQGVSLNWRGLESFAKSVENLSRWAEANQAEKDAESYGVHTFSQLLTTVPTQPFRQVKVNFPKFDGIKPLDWLFRANQYF